jgi:hypothetical protein
LREKTLFSNVFSMQVEKKIRSVHRMDVGRVSSPVKFPSLITYMCFKLGWQPWFKVETAQPCSIDSLLNGFHLISGCPLTFCWESRTRLFCILPLMAKVQKPMKSRFLQAAAVPLFCFQAED